MGLDPVALDEHLQQVAYGTTVSCSTGKPADAFVQSFRFIFSVTLSTSGNFKRW